jgi:glycosyltransferase involved in cell wall biosynthesis
MKLRLGIITEIIAPYRIPVFNALARDPDVEPHVIFLSETDSSLRGWRVRKDEIAFSYEVLPSFRRRVGKYNLLLNRGITAALRRAAPEVLLCGGYSYVASWQAAAWVRRRHIPLLLWVESTGQDRRRNFAGVERLKRRFIEWSDGFVVPGRSSADYLRTFGIAEHMIFQAPNAVDNEFFTNVSKQKRDSNQTAHLPPRFFLYVGRLIREKGAFDLLAAYGKLPKRVREDFGLVFAGAGSCRPELQELARGVDAGAIVFTGFLEKEELADIYARAAALVFPTHSDPWGLVVNEAIACGLPIIATSVAGCVANLVEDGWNGMLVPPANPGALAAAMQSLACDELRATMAANSWRRSHDYSPEACARGLAQAAAALECVRG